MLGKASEINITVMIKNGGYENVILPASLIGELSKAIQHKGSEVIHLASGRTLEVVGLIVKGDMTGARIIVIGEEAHTHE